jgi:hypothetical protein
MVLKMKKIYLRRKFRYTSRCSKNTVTDVRKAAFLARAVELLTALYDNIVEKAQNQTILSCSKYTLSRT